MCYEVHMCVYVCKFVPVFGCLFFIMRATVGICFANSKQPMKVEAVVKKLFVTGTESPTDFVNKYIKGEQGGTESIAEVVRRMDMDLTKSVEDSKLKKYAKPIEASYDVVSLGVREMLEYGRSVSSKDRRNIARGWRTKAREHKDDKVWAEFSGFEIERNER